MLVLPLSAVYNRFVFLPFVGVYLCVIRNISSIKKNSILYKYVMLMLPKSYIGFCAFSVKTYITNLQDHDKD